MGSMFGCAAKMQSIRLFDCFYRRLERFDRSEIKPSRISVVLGGSDLVTEVLFAQRSARLLTAITKNQYPCLDDRFVYETLSKSLLNEIKRALERKRDQPSLILLDQPERALLFNDRLRFLMGNNQCFRCAMVIAASVDYCNQADWSDLLFRRRDADYLFLTADGLDAQARSTIWSGFYYLQSTYDLAEFSHLLDVYDCLVLDLSGTNPKLYWYKPDDNLAEFKFNA